VTRGSSGAAQRHKVGAGAQVTRGGSGAAPSRWGTWRGVPGAVPSCGGTWRPRSCPEPGAEARAVGTPAGLGAALSREAGAVFLTWSLYVGVPGPQGTDSGPWAHRWRGCELAGGANILFPRNLSESLCVGIPKQWCSTADTSPRRADAGAGRHPEGLGRPPGLPSW
jgi:hypothetical protein